MTKKLVLVVDDDREFSASVATRCRSMGLEAVTASNTLSALALLDDHHPDLICVDVEMPTGNGLSLCEFLFDGYIQARPPVIIVTGRNDADTRRRCSELQASYVQKSPHFWQSLWPAICERLGLEPVGTTALAPVAEPESPSRTAPAGPVAAASQLFAGKRVLIADDDPDIVNLLILHCRQLGFTVDAASSALTALTKMEQNPPDVAILDVEMPRGNGLCVREMMAEHRELAAIPVIVLTASSAEDTVRRCHQQCSYYVLKCPDVWSRVEPLLHELFRRSGTLTATACQDSAPVAANGEPRVHADLIQAVFAILGAEEADPLVDDEEYQPRRTDEPWVLAIEDDDDFALALQLRLSQLGVRVIRATEGAEGYRRAVLDAPRAIILDYELPRGNGEYVLRRLQESCATSSIPVIVLTGRREANIERQMRRLGASEFLSKPLDWNRLRSTLQGILDKSPPPVPLAGPAAGVG